MKELWRKFSKRKKIDSVILWWKHQSKDAETNLLGNLKDHIGIILENVHSKIIETFLPNRPRWKWNIIMRWDSIKARRWNNIPGCSVPFHKRLVSERHWLVGEREIHFGNTKNKIHWIVWWKLMSKRSLTTLSLLWISFGECGEIKVLKFSK